MRKHWPDWDADLVEQESSLTWSKRYWATMTATFGISVSASVMSEFQVPSFQFQAKTRSGRAAGGVRGSVAVFNRNSESRKSGTPLVWWSQETSVEKCALTRKGRNGAGIRLMRFGTDAPRGAGRSLGAAMRPVPDSGTPRPSSGFARRGPRIRTGADAPRTRQASAAGAGVSPAPKLTVGDAVVA